MLSIKCPYCLTPYLSLKNQGVSPVIGVCGHSVCSSCLDKLVESVCLNCRRRGSFQIPIRNYMADELLQYIEETTDSPDFKQICEDDIKELEKKLTRLTGRYDELRRQSRQMATTNGYFGASEVHWTPFPQPVRPEETQRSRMQQPQRDGFNWGSPIGRGRREGSPTVYCANPYCTQCSN